MRRWVLGFALLLLVPCLAYGAVAATLWRMQESLIFPAPGGIDVSALDQAASEVGAEPFRIHAADGTKLYGWHRSPPPNGAKHCGVLYFHGNAETVAASVALGRLVTREGCDFLVVAYRGYPGSAGKPSESGIALDARALWDHATVDLGIPPERILLHGRSLGGGVAVGLASEVTPGALAIEASFTSLVDVAAARYPFLPVRRLLRHRFDSIGRAPGIAVPTLVVHGSADRTIPVSHGRALAKAFPNARYIEASGLDHDDALFLADAAADEAYVALLDWLADPDRAGKPPGWP
jgi:pimeloyl-ACP methyl ester carboxylesterase